MLPSAEVHIETMELHAVESSDSGCENTDDEFEQHAGQVVRIVPTKGTQGTKKTVALFRPLMVLLFMKHYLLI